jgi:transcriptional regulator with XRE-family HTH domain
MKKIIEHGRAQRIAKRAGISQQFLSNILNRRRHANEATAKKLERASSDVLGKRIRADEWQDAENSPHPAFVGPPMFLR